MNFWDVHSFWFLFAIAFFPRITMLFAGICAMPFAYPVWFWLGWILAPRLVVAILATTFYWGTNPILCVLAWIIALSGESMEKKTILTRARRQEN